MTRWVVFGEAKVGYVDGEDRASALSEARRAYGEAVLRVQSARSVQLAEEERRTAERDRLREAGW